MELLVIFKAAVYDFYKEMSFICINKVVFTYIVFYVSILNVFVFLLKDFSAENNWTLMSNIINPSIPGNRWYNYTPILIY